eukprot:6325807-Amphidinium_carterae.1
MKKLISSLFSKVCTFFVPSLLRLPADPATRGAEVLDCVPVKLTWGESRKQRTSTNDKPKEQLGVQKHAMKTCA